MGNKLVFLDDGFFDIKFTYFYFWGILGYKKRVVRYKLVPPDPPDHCNTIKESTSLSDSSNLKT